MKITCLERIGEDDEPVSAPVIPPSATMDEIEVIEAAPSAASMTDELGGHLSQSVTCDSFAR